MADARRKYGIREWEAVRRAVSEGATVREAAARAGVSRMTAQRLSRVDVPDEGMWPEMDGAGKTGPRAAGARLSYEDRCLIAALAADGRTRSHIARAVGCHRTTVARELGRCPEGEYDPRSAQRDAYLRARRPKARKLDSNPRLRAFVAGRLAQRWSPRQISARLPLEYPGDGGMRVSHEAIYQSIYVQGKGSLRQEVAVEAALRRGREKRVPRSRMPPRPRGKSWVEGCLISERPAEAADRAVPGHWEGDLVVSANGSCLVTLVERRTRFLLARRLDEHSTRTVVDLLIGMVESVPEAVRAGLLKTLTWDQGAELADAARFTAATGFRVYFCDPHSPWEKGSNENTNGLIRQYFPKGTDFRKVTDEEVARMQDQLNGRPRETLGWRTPAEEIQSLLEKGNRAATD